MEYENASVRTNCVEQLQKTFCRCAPMINSRYDLGMTSSRKLCKFRDYVPSTRALNEGDRSSKMRPGTRQVFFQVVAEAMR